MKNERRMSRWILGVLAAAVVVGCFGNLSAAGPRLSVTVDEPFVVDGRVYPAGTLSLKPVKAFTPTTTLNEVWVGKRCLGMLAASHAADPTLEASRNAVLFVRDSDGRLELRGFAYRTDGPGDRYRYALLAPREVAGSRTLVDDAPTILIAARIGR